MEFREFYDHSAQFTDLDVAQLYFHQQGMPVREIAGRTGRSIGEVYRILRHYGQPNRVRNNRHSVLALADSNMSPQQISSLTGYTTRHVRNILRERR